MNIFRGLRPLQRAVTLRDVLAGVVLAAMDVPQMKGSSKIAGMPFVIGALHCCFGSCGERRPDRNPANTAAPVTDMPG